MNVIPFDVAFGESECRSTVITHRRMTTEIGNRRANTVGIGDTSSEITGGDALVHGHVAQGRVEQFALLLVALDDACEPTVIITGQGAFEWIAVLIDVGERPARRRRYGQEMKVSLVDDRTCGRFLNACEQIALFIGS